jgi:hypothetical protein
MPIPIICATQALCQFTADFAQCFSRRQRKYFVTVLLALLLSEDRRTLSGLLRRVADRVSLCGLSRFLSRSPWSEERLCQLWLERFRDQLAPIVRAEHQHQLIQRPKRPGRPAATLVTGYLLMDDSVHAKPKGRKMGGLGYHYSSTERRRVRGHCLFTSLYVIGERRCPLPPQLYTTNETCQKEGREFKSKVDLACETVDAFEPVPDAHTHVLCDCWYICQALWKRSRKRGFDMSGGVRANRSLRITTPEGDRQWQKLPAYAATLTASDFEAVVWPSDRGGQTMYVHTVRTLIRKLGACRLLVVRPEPNSPPAQTRYFVSSLLDASAQEIVNALAVRWNIETFFEDVKELFGTDHYQLMDPRAIRRFWSLASLAYAFLEEQRAASKGPSITIGQMRAMVQREHNSNLLRRLTKPGHNKNVICQLEARLAA